MNIKVSFLDLISEYDSKEKIVFKKIYQKINDVKIIDFLNIEITLEEFERIKYISKKYINKEDITFDIGYRYFRNNKINLLKGVFVPQFDTEQIIDIVHELKLDTGIALEIGSGSGAIAISLEKETNFEVDSIDINRKATELSKENDINNKVNFINIDFFKYDPKEKYDLLISNPPYISKNDNNVEEWVLENQPSEALFAKDDGIQFYKYMFENVNKFLNKNAYLILEIGFSQAKEIIKLAENISDRIKVIKDYSGFERFIILENNKDF